MSQGQIFNQPFTSAPPSVAYHPDMQAPYMQFAASVPPRNQSTHLPQMTFQNPGFQNQDPLLHQQLINPFSTSPFQGSDSIGSSPTTSVGKQMQTKAERRAEHNAIERARRESLNSKFQQLAHCLPNLQNDSRPSKSTIIERTLDFVKGAILKEERMQNQINELERVNRYLLSQLDSKQQHHQSTSAANTPSPSSAMSEDSLNLDDELIMIEKRKFKKDCNRLRQTKRKESPGLDFPPSVSSHPEAVNPVPHQSCNQSVPMVPKQKFQVNMPATAFYPSNYAIPNNNKMKEALYFQPQNQPMFQPLQYNSDNDDDEDNSMDMNQINNNNATFDLQPTSHNFQPMMPGPLSLNQLDTSIMAHDPYHVMQHRH